MPIVTFEGAIEILLTIKSPFRASVINILDKETENLARGNPKMVKRIQRNAADPTREIYRQSCKVTDETPFEIDSLFNVSGSMKVVAYGVVNLYAGTPIMLEMIRRNAADSDKDMLSRSCNFCGVMDEKLFQCSKCHR